MTKFQRIALIVAIVNLVLVALFPPYDYVSAARNNVATFDGFGFYFSAQPNRVLNADFLQIELFVILANACIAWLLLGRRPAERERPRTDWQKVVLFGVALNLLLVLLFPPMQNYKAITKAALPSFDGFYFVFGGYDMYVIVTPMLYLEVIFILINGAMLYLLFSKAKPVDINAAAKALAAEMKRQR